METKTFKPGPRYQTKLILVSTVIAVIIVLFVVLPASWVDGKENGLEDGMTMFLVLSLLNLVWYLPTLLLIRAYYRSLIYEIHDDEIIVHVGIWTKSTKHVPFRTVTNIQVNRDIFDRWFFKLGSLNVQTAGMSGRSGAEEALLGLPNVLEIYELVSSRLRNFRGAMEPTAAGKDD